MSKPSKMEAFPKFKVVYKRCFYTSLLVLCLNLVLFSCKKTVDEPVVTPGPPPVVPPPTTDTISVHLTLGNPSGAIVDVNSFTNYLMVKHQYALSYHRDRGTPNWISWHLDASWLGSESRQDDFRVDGSLPAGWYRVQATDYSSSGFDRGHNCPSADRTKNLEDNSATFLMTNMIPQAAKNNQQTWANLESYCRTLVLAGNELYIVMGSYGMGGTGSAGTKNSIAGGKVTIPARIWKVVVVLPQGSDDVSGVQLQLGL